MSASWGDGDAWSEFERLARLAEGAKIELAGLKTLADYYTDEAGATVLGTNDPRKRYFPMVEGEPFAMVELARGCIADAIDSRGGRLVTGDGRRSLKHSKNVEFLDSLRDDPDLEEPNQAVYFAAKKLTLRVSDALREFEKVAAARSAIVLQKKADYENGLAARIDAKSSEIDCYRSNMLIAARRIIPGFDVDGAAMSVEESPPFGGVYILMVDGRIYYVGQSASIWSRLNMDDHHVFHSRDGVWRNFRVAWIQCDDDGERIELERRMIISLKPELNIIHNRARAEVA
jgi:hypothetical protein